MRLLGTLLRMGARRRALVPTVLTIVVVALAAAALCSAMLVRRDASRAVDDAFAAAEGPELILWTDTTSTGRALESLRTDPRVVEIASQRRVTDAQAVLGDDRVDLAVNGVPSPAGLNAPVLTAGRLPTASGEIAFDAALAADRGLTIGDTVTVVRGSASSEFTLVGLAYDFTDCFFPNCDPARVWSVDEDVKALDPHPTVMLAVDLSKPQHAEAVARSISKEVSIVGYGTWLDTRGDLLAESTFFSAFLAAFGVVALVAAVVVVAGMATARTWSRRRHLAQLRSLGSTRRQVIAALVVEHALIGLTGCLLGCALAVLVSPVLRIGVMRVLDGGSGAAPTGVMVIVAGIVTVTVVLATLIPAAHAGRLDVVAGLRAGLGPQAVGRFRVIERTPLPVSGELGLRSALARPVRTILCALAVMLAVATSMIAVSINSTMDDLLARPELTGDPADVSLEATGSPTREVARALDGMEEVSQWFSVVDTTADVGERTVHLKAVGGDPAANGHVIGDGRPLSGSGQAIAGYGLVKSADWRLGQSLRLDVGGSPIEVTLIGWYRETEDSGEVIQIRADDLPSGVDVEPPRFEISRAEGITPAELIAELRTRFGDSAAVQVERPDAGHLAPFRLALAMMAGLTAVVALANLIGTAVVAARERTARTGTLRALGMCRRAAYGEAVGTVAIPLVAAVVFGLPLGWFVARGMGDALTGELGAGPGLTILPSTLQVATIVLLATVAASLVAVAASTSTIRRPIADLVRVAT